MRLNFVATHFFAQVTYIMPLDVLFPLRGGVVSSGPSPDMIQSFLAAVQAATAAKALAGADAASTRVCAVIEPEAPVVTYTLLGNHKYFTPYAGL